jgi:hypothetical protein
MAWLTARKDAEYATEPGKTGTAADINANLPSHAADGDQSGDNGSLVDAQTYAYSEDRKIGVTGAVFLILNKMIGTGSTFLPFPN